MKDKNVDFNAGKWKNEMPQPGVEPGTFSTEVRCPYPYTKDSLGNLAKKLRYSIFSGKKLLIFKAGNSNHEKFKILKASRVHIFQA